MHRYACALLIRDGAILLGKRAPHRKAYANSWDVIGGRIEAGESAETALARELREEIGVVPTAWIAAGDLEDHRPDARGSAIYHMFAVSRWVGEPAMRNHEHTEVQWFPIEQACGLSDLALAEYPALFRRIRGLIP